MTNAIVLTIKQHSNFLKTILYLCTSLLISSVIYSQNNDRIIGEAELVGETSITSSTGDDGNGQSGGSTNNGDVGPNRDWDIQINSTNKGYRANGKVNYQNAIYNGETYNGRENGRGILAYKDGDFVYGEFHNGAFIKGKGRLTYMDGKYSGEMKKTTSGISRQGIGQLDMYNGNSFYGRFENNMFISGSANISTSKGKYTGDVIMKNGKPLYHGKGVFRFNSGSVFSGLYDRGKRVSGSFISKSGVKKVGRWTNGKFKGKISLDISKLSPSTIDALKEFEEMKELANVLYLSTAFAPLVLHFTSGTNWSVPKGTAVQVISKRNVLAIGGETHSVFKDEGDWSNLALAVNGINSITRAKFIQYCEKQMLINRNKNLDYLFWKNLRASFK